MVVRLLACLCLVAASSAAMPTPTRATYLGGERCLEQIEDVVVAGGEVYVAGHTSWGCDDFPVTAGGAFLTPAGSVDVFIARLSTDLSTLLGATYFGGTGYDAAFDMVVTTDSVYIAGHTNSASLPGTALAAQPVSGGGMDAFAARFDRELGQLIQATFLGGSDTDGAAGIAVLGDTVYLAGATHSLDLPGASGGQQPIHGGGWEDGFVASLSSSLQGPILSTYLGGAGTDVVSKVAANADAIFVAGATDSPAFPGVKTGPQPEPGGFLDAFVARLDHDLSQPVRSSYLGGHGDDWASDIAISGDAVYITGGTSSPDLPFTVGGAQPTGGSGANQDAFAARFELSLTGGVQATYFVDGFLDGFRLWVGAGSVIVAGTAEPGDEAFVAFFRDDLRTLDRVIGYGGSKEENCRAVTAEFNAAGGVGSVFLAGGTASKDLPAIDGAFQPDRRGTLDGFVARLELDLND